MISLCEAKQHIVNIWGSQKIKFDQTYRLMTYVLKVECEDKIALLNVVTGKLVFLEAAERIVFESLPANYDSVMESLIKEYFLVPIDFDEHQQVKNIRYILQKLQKNSKDVITKYVILPTTACNARCYYCFEAGVETHTMSEQSAEDVVKYIVEHSEGNKIQIMWFGGEPTVAKKRITQICDGLKKQGIEFFSKMISNAYLFDEKIVEEAKTIWNLKHIQITIDGSELTYNKIKNYVNVTGSPYKKVLQNVSSLINNKINVSVRMNVDLNNYQDFSMLLNDISTQIGKSDYLQVFAHPVIGEYPNENGITLHGDEDWMAQKIIDLNQQSMDAGFYNNQKMLLPFLKYTGCMADNDSNIVIGPLGTLSRCCERFENEEIVGNIYDGIINKEHYYSWKEIADYEKCQACIFYPECVKLVNCSSGDFCKHWNRNRQYTIMIKNLVTRYNKEVKNNDF